MKKVLLLIFSLFLAQYAWAYQTVIVDFPDDEGWHAVYYATQGSETILQYAPSGSTSKNWTRTVVFHAYRDSTATASSLLDQLTSQMELQNPSSKYSYTKYTDEDSMATRCTTKTMNNPAQCEILRISTSYEGPITMHYINKNIQSFKSNYRTWYQAMLGVRIYYSYYMNDRILNKATVFEI